VRLRLGLRLRVPVGQSLSVRLTAYDAEFFCTGGEGSRRLRRGPSSWAEGMPQPVPLSVCRHHLQWTRKSNT